MSYQQPPQGYPPQQGYGQQPQQPQQGYQQPPAPAGYNPGAMRVPGGDASLPPNLLILGMLLLIGGAFIRSILGFFNPGNAWKYIGTIGILAQAVGELGVAAALIVAGLKEKDHSSAVKVAAIVVGGILVIHGIQTSGTNILGGLIGMLGGGRHGMPDM